MITIEFEGVAGALRALGVAAEGMEDFSYPMLTSLRLFSVSVEENILASGRPPYPDILPESRAHRRFDPSMPPLWDSGEMVAAATATAPGVDGSTFAIAPDGLAGEIGVQDAFHGARRHQMGYGGPDSRGRSFDEPARAFLVIQTEDRSAVIEVFDAYVGALCGEVK